jgi:hypothetical protein
MLARTNKSAGQLRPGEIFKSHSRHPSEWIMICREPRRVKVRRLNDVHDAIIPLTTRVYSVMRQPVRKHARPAL